MFPGQDHAVSLCMGFFRDGFDTALHAGGESVHEMANKLRNIFATFAQRRHLDREHAEAVEQVAAKFMLGPFPWPSLDWWLRPAAGLL